MNKHTQCSICRTKLQNIDLKVIDYTVSHQQFNIDECPSCKLRVTNPFPSETEIGKYYESEDYISHSDTSKSLMSKLYQTVRKITLKQKGKLVTEVSGKGSGHILDVGAGTGHFLNTMQELGWQTTGVEPSEKAIAYAKKQFNLTLLPTDQLKSLPEASFDVITLWHVLEHVHDLNEYVSTLQRLLTPDGTLFIAVPNYTSNDGKLYQQYWAGYDVPRHLFHFSPFSMQVLLENNGFKLIEKKKMFFDAFYVSMLSEKYKKGKVNYPKAFMNGLASNVQAFKTVNSCSSIIYVAQK